MTWRDLWQWRCTARLSMQVLAAGRAWRRTSASTYPLLSSTQNALFPFCEEFFMRSSCKGQTKFSSLFIHSLIEKHSIIFNTVPSDGKLDMETTHISMLNHIHLTPADSFRWAPVVHWTDFRFNKCLLLFVTTNNCRWGRDKTQPMVQAFKYRMKSNLPTHLYIK